MLENPDAELQDDRNERNLCGWLNEGQRNGVENGLADNLQRMRPNSIQPIKTLNRVVRSMDTPEERHFVKRAVEPVAEEIFDQDEESDEIELYPNPCRDYITFKLKDNELGNIHIIDSKRIDFTSNLQFTIIDEGVAKITVSNLNRGIYIIDTGFRRKKFIKL